MAATVANSQGTSCPSPTGVGLASVVAVCAHPAHCLSRGQAQRRTGQRSDHIPYLGRGWGTEAYARSVLGEMP